MHRHEPMSTDEHRGRYHAALRRLYTRQDIIDRHKDGAPPPAEETFDWPDGIRLLITCEDHDKDGGVVVHVSGSACPGTKSASLGSPRNPMLAFAIRARFHELTGYALPMEHFMWSPAGYPHWYVPAVLVPGPWTAQAAGLPPAESPRTPGEDVAPPGELFAPPPPEATSGPYEEGR